MLWVTVGRSQTCQHAHVALRVKTFLNLHKYRRTALQMLLTDTCLLQYVSDGVWHNFTYRQALRDGKLPWRRKHSQYWELLMMKRHIRDTLMWPYSSFMSVLPITLNNRLPSAAGVSGGLATRTIIWSHFLGEIYGNLRCLFFSVNELERKICQQKLRRRVNK